MFGAPLSGVSVAQLAAKALCSVTGGKGERQETVAKNALDHHQSGNPVNLLHVVRVCSYYPKIILA